MVTGGLTSIDAVDYYRIDGTERMEPFLMTVVSDSDLWMFVSSTGALTAGRVDADHALFPYVTDDLLHRAAGQSGPLTVIARVVDGRRELWRPFHAEPGAGCTRSIAKSVLGDRLLFEERHREWGLSFRATWAPSAAYGWVRTVEVADEQGGGGDLEVLDGLVDLMPAGVDAGTEQIRSNLVDAYKRAETGPWGTLAVYSIEALVTDRAEPAESLTAATVWSWGLGDAVIDLDPRGVAAMVQGRPGDPGHLVTGRAGAYLLRAPVSLAAGGSASWTIVADTGLAHPEVLATSRHTTDPNAAKAVIEDVDAGSARLRGLLSGADAFQSTADRVVDAHHLSNVLFNSMRGGVFPYGHRVPVADFTEFVRTHNREVANRCTAWFGSLDHWVDESALRDAALDTCDDDLIRMVLDYLPLTFSRRHGDPSRPWNRFAINVKADDGGQVLSYEGNWRDIFQNWEALLSSFPAYFVNVVAKFVNATTLDGHNPYRISREGIDWEVPDPDDAWSNIGYWGDHQIVYLLRLLEAWDQHEPGSIGEWLDRSVFVYADVPYVIADFGAMVRDPRNTISFDAERADMIARREREVGADGRLVVDADGDRFRVGLAEKLLVPALAKLSSFVPGGGIWMNTQRPEWNDANNALAGPGLSMVTLYYLRRYLWFLDARIAEVEGDSIAITSSVAEWFAELGDVLDEFPPAQGPSDDRARRSIVDALGSAGAAHRRRVRDGVGITRVDVPVAEVRRRCRRALEHLDASIRNGRRTDGLYHSYNLVSFPAADTTAVDHLGPMLEGQVAALSSGVLEPDEALDLIDELFGSAMYRPDINTFMLYPIVELVPFLARNILPDDAPWTSDDLDGPLERIFAADLDGRLRFRSDVVNADALADLLDAADLAEAGRLSVLAAYEEVFHQHSFTGRSSSMYGYEGIGSVYWHMVSKLLLAVQELYWSALDAGSEDVIVERLAGAYRRIREGLGFRKDPAAYGAFPTDCYSHTPLHAGAQQPGMTGQVKEEVLARFGELGVRVLQGRISLSPGLLPLSELIPGDADGTARFTLCSVPMTLARSEADAVTLVRADGSTESRDALVLTSSESRDVLARSGAITRVEWAIGSDR